MINEDNFKQTIAKNLITYRKINNLTQLDLADKLNYSDKAISKWERGESLPDTYTLYKLASFYGITLDELCGITTTNVHPKEKKRAKHLFITLLSLGLVWFVATLIFAVLELIPLTKDFDNWMTFIIAVPVSFIVLTVFGSLWYNYIYQGIFVSGIVWGVALTVHLFLAIYNISSASLMYIIAIPFQVLVILWFVMLKIKHR